MHLIGLTLIVGSSLVSRAALAGWDRQRTADFRTHARPRRATIVGLIISVTTGLLLVSFRIAMSFASRAFQVKLLPIAVAIPFPLHRLCAGGSRPAFGLVSAALAGVVAFLLWFSVVLAGCAFILYD